MKALSQSALVLACSLLLGQALAEEHDELFFNKQTDIARYLRAFHTFNGKPLYAMLSSYGVYVTNVLVEKPDPATSQDLKPGDWVVTITLDSPLPEKLPCHLSKWATSAGGVQMNFVRRTGHFPLLQPDKDDPVTYWAATGKCSPAYKF
jgi:hypothetical protein